jgi:hypothetical protein
MKSERQRPLLCEVGARPLRDEPRGWDEGAATLREVEPLHLGLGGYRWHLELGEGAIDGAWSPEPVVPWELGSVSGLLGA